MRGERPVLTKDWDDVGYDFQLNWLPVYNAEHGTSFSKADIVDHNLHHILDQSPEYIEAHIRYFHKFFETTDHGLMPLAQEVIPVLAETFDIVIVTARPKIYEQNIHAMIERYIPGCISAVYSFEDYRTDYENKGAFVKSLGAVALIDDHIPNIHSAVANGVRGLLWTMRKNMYHPVTVERVADWYDVYEKLMGRPFIPSLRPSGIGGRSADPA